MKADIRRTSPKTQETLCNCLIESWNSITIKKCNSLIDHVKKTVFPEVVRVNGLPLECKLKNISMLMERHWETTPSLLDIIIIP